MAEGTTMKGTVSPTDLQVTLDGASPDRSVYFSIHIADTSTGAVTLPGCSTTTTSGQESTTT